jgi:hypothetical protein
MEPRAHIAAAAIARGSAWAGHLSVWAGHPSPATPIWAAIVIGALLAAPVVVGLGFAIVGGRRPRNGGDDERGSGPGGGGGGPPGPRPLGHRPSGGEPVWWSDFERQFAAYVAGLSSDKRQVLTTQHESSNTRSNL